MKHYILIIFITILLVGCAEDDSTLLYPGDNPNFSMISISSPTDTLSVDAGDVLNFTPVVSQLVDSKDLEYIWSTIGGKGMPQTDSLRVGFEKELSYTFPEAGSYFLRLEVKNEDYSVFKTWHVDVRLQDEGLMIIGEDDGGEMMMSFARKLSETDLLEGKELSFVTDVLKNVNPNLKVTDVVRVIKTQTGYSLRAHYIFIFTKTHIYIVDGRTFNLINTVNFSDQFNGETIESISSAFEPYRTVQIFTSAGRIVLFDKRQFLAYPSSQYEGYTFEAMLPDMDYVYRGSETAGFLNVNYSESKLYNFYIWYGTNRLMNNTTGIPEGGTEWTDNVKPNEYEGRDIIGVSRMLGDSYSIPIDFVSISLNKADATKVKVVRFGLGFRDGSFTNVGEPYVYNTSNLTYVPHSEITPNGRYNCFYYFNENNIYKWNPFTASNMALPETPSVTLDGDKEITCMSISWDMKELYVGFYDPSATGELKGGMYVYDAGEIGLDADLQPIQKFEGVSTKPKQVFYMPKGLGSYSLR